MSFMFPIDNVVSEISINQQTQNTSLRRDRNNKKEIMQKHKKARALKLFMYKA